MSSKTRVVITAGIAMAFSGQVMAGALNVYILVGQSNMQGHAHVRTFEHIGMDPETAPLLDKMVNADGSPRVFDNVWISAIGCADDEKTGKLTAGFGAEKNGPKIGPEFTFGMTMQEHAKEPILIIKTAWGGKSLHTDFRPPSAGAYTISEQQRKGMEAKGADIDAEQAKRAEQSGHYYRLMIEHVKMVLADIQRVYPGYQPEQGYELAGFVWFQGWNDMTDSGVYPNRGKAGGYDAYTRLLAQFIRDVRRDLTAPKLPFVIGVMGVGGDIASKPATRYTPIHLEFRKAMAAPAQMPEFKGNVVAVETFKCWDPQLSELQGRKQKIKARETELKAQGLSGQELRSAVDAYQAEIYTPRELEILQKGISNFEFHYLGSGKIMARIGVAFADALKEVK